MTTNLRLLGAAAVFLAMAGYFFRDVRQTEAERLAAVGRTATLTARAQNLQRDLARKKRDEASLAQSLQRASAPRPAPAKPGFDLADELQHDPKVIARFRADQRAAFTAAYGPLQRQLHLDPAALERWESAYVDYKERLVDLAASAKGKDLTDSDPAIQTIRRQDDEALAAAEREALGSSYGALVQYDRVLPVRALVSQFAGATAFSSPLTAEQGEQLSQAIANASQPYQSGGAADWGQVDWDKVDQAAQRFLTPQQMAAWQQAEPMGGGPSRWMAVLGGRMTAAEQSDAQAAASH